MADGAGQRSPAAAVRAPGPAGVLLDEARQRVRALALGMVAHPQCSSVCEACEAEHMASKATRNDFIEMVAQEVSSGIEQALGYWLGRIEVEWLIVV